MNIQSLSVCVPAGCPNKCKFCVSELHRNDDYVNQIEKNRRFRDLYRNDYTDRMAFARDNGCNTLMFTGDGEPLMNPRFIEDVGEWNRGLDTPFRWLELQTSGITLDDEKLRWLRNSIRVSTISLSLSNIFDSNLNAECNQTPANFKVDIDKTCSEVKRYDFNLRLSLNLTDMYNSITPAEIFKRAAELKANQITFRVLYETENPVAGTEGVNEWIKAHRVSSSLVDGINRYIVENGRKLEVLPFGATRYSVHGMSCVIDSDCMSTALDKDAIKYLILRPDCKLYTKWDDIGSILF